MQADALEQSAGLATVEEASSEGMRRASRGAIMRRGAPRRARARGTSLHVSKLRGITYELRGKLKKRGITYADQLLESTGSARQRGRLAAAAGVEEAALTHLACRADLARVKGIGAIFADMLELVGVDRVTRLARQESAKLHRALYELNVSERFARRAPTPEEVANWVVQAKMLPHRLDDD